MPASSNAGMMESLQKRKLLCCVSQSVDQDLNVGSQEQNMIWVGGKTYATEVIICLKIVCTAKMTDGQRKINH
jgi:hypothetical protein